MRLPLQQAERGIDAALPQMRGQNLAGQPACIWPIRARPAFARTRLDQNADLSNFNSGRIWQYGSSAEPARGADRELPGYMPEAVQVGEGGSYATSSAGTEGGRKW